MSDALENVPLTPDELALARRWATSQIGRPSTRTDTQPLSQRKATVLIYRLLATIDRSEVVSPAMREALEAEWYNGNLDERAYDRLLEVLERAAPPSENGAA